MFRDSLEDYAGYENVSCLLSSGHLMTAKWGDAIYLRGGHSLRFVRKGASMSFTKLTWGVKASFRSYVEAAGGSITVSDGAIRAEDGTFVFMAEPNSGLAIAADGSVSGAMRFKGTVSFEAHGGMLKTTLSQLGLEAAESGLVLTVLEGPMNKGRCAVAELGPVDVGTGGVTTINARITMDGMYQIADNYPPGTELDPVLLA